MGKLYIKDVELLLQQGMSYKQIGDIYHVSRQAVFELCKRNGKLPLKQFKKDLPEEPSLLEQRKRKFPLGEALYSQCSLRFHRKKQNCKYRKIPFDLTMDDLTWPTHCPILGIPIDYENIEKARIENSPSFDKINPQLGYIPGNVQILSWRANRIKNDGTAEEHQKIADFMKNNDLVNVE